MNTLVNFELAKMLKEKDFDLPVRNVFETSMLHGRECYFFEKEFELDNHNKKDGENTSYYSRPTISEVVMWLYEKHGIWIQVEWSWIGDDMKSLYFPRIIYIKRRGQEKLFEYFNSPTEAYEAAIEYVLKNLT